MNDKHYELLVKIDKDVAVIKEHITAMNGDLKGMKVDVEKNTGFRFWAKGAIAGIGTISIILTVLAVSSYIH